MSRPRVPRVLPEHRGGRLTHMCVWNPVGGDGLLRTLVGPVHFCPGCGCVMNHLDVGDWCVGDGCTWRVRALDYDDGRRRALKMPRHYDDGQRRAIYLRRPHG